MQKYTWKMASNSLKNPGKILEFCGCGKVGTLLGPHCIGIYSMNKKWKQTGVNICWHNYSWRYRINSHILHLLEKRQVNILIILYFKRSVLQIRPCESESIFWSLQWLVLVIIGEEYFLFVLIQFFFYIYRLTPWCSLSRLRLNVIELQFNNCFLQWYRV